MSSDLNDRLAVLKKTYAASFPAKRAEIDAALQLAGTGEGVAQLRHLAHKLAGSGASYGFAELSSLSRRLESAAISRQGGNADADLEGAALALLKALEAQADA